MKRAFGGIFVAAQMAVMWFAVAQTDSNYPTQLTPAAAAPRREPAIVVSPSSLDFGLVGVGRTKELNLTVRNVGEGTLRGTATVRTPFTIAGESYSLSSGQSQSLTVRYRPTAEGTNHETVVFSGAGLVTVPVIGSARTPPAPPGKLRFKPSRVAKEQVETASFIVRYYSNQESYLVKPLKMDPGGFMTVFDRASLLKLAADQAERELAIVLLPFYAGSALEVAARQSWLQDLTALGYRRVLFGAGRSVRPVTRIEGAIILEDPQNPTLPAGD